MTTSSNQASGESYPAVPPPLWRRRLPGPGSAGAVQSARAGIVRVSAVDEDGEAGGLVAVGTLPPGVGAGNRERAVTVRRVDAERNPGFGRRDYRARLPALRPDGDGGQRQQQSGPAQELAPAEQAGRGR